MEALDGAQRVSSELREKIEIARKEYREGKYICCSTKEEIHALIYGL
ncbi:MAG: hypothetical protein LUI09_04175 [Prevotellaceae bacterium]|nr:hypothetical protein [Prevotellaceae bacterium]